MADSRDARGGRAHATTETTEVRRGGRVTLRQPAAWPRRKIGWLLAAPLGAVAIAGGTLWAVPSIESELEDQTRADLEAAGIDTADLDIDYSYRSGTIRGVIPTGADETDVKGLVEYRGIRDLDLEVGTESGSSAQDAVSDTGSIEGGTGGEQAGPTQVQATFDTDTVTLTGTVADEATRDQLLRAAAARVGQDAVEDQLTIDPDTATTPGTDALAALLQDLDPTTTGTVNLDDTTLDLTATAPTQTTADATTALLDEAAADLTTTADITTTNDSPDTTDGDGSAAEGDDADGDSDSDSDSGDDSTGGADSDSDTGSIEGGTGGEQAGPTQVQATFDTDTVTLTGTVADEATRDQLLRAAAARVGQDAVEDQLTIDPDTATTPGTDALAALLQDLDPTTTGTVNLDDTTLDLTATAPTQTTADATTALLDEAAADLTTTADITTTNDSPDTTDGDGSAAEGDDADGDSDSGGPDGGDGSAAEGDDADGDSGGPDGGDGSSSTDGGGDSDSDGGGPDDGTESLEELAARFGDVVLFAPASSGLDAEANEIIAQVAAAMAASPDARLVVIGHTDSLGPAEANQRLGRARADAVVARLVSLGVPTDRLTARSAGERSPVADNATDEGRACNRRTALRVIS